MEEDWFEKFMAKVDEALGKPGELPESQRSIEAYEAMIETIRRSLFGSEEDDI